MSGGGPSSQGFGCHSCLAIARAYFLHLGLSQAASLRSAPARAVAATCRESDLQQGDHPMTTPTPQVRHGTPAQAVEDAVSLHRGGRLSEAEQIYLVVLAVEPRNFDCLHNLSLIRRQKGRLDEALALAARAHDADPRSPRAHDTLGSTLLRLNRPEEAIAAYEQAIALKPDCTEAHSNLAGAFAWSTCGSATSRPDGASTNGGGCAGMRRRSVATSPNRSGSARVRFRLYSGYGPDLLIVTSLP